MDPKDKRIVTGAFLTTIIDTVTNKVIPHFVNLGEWSKRAHPMALMNGEYITYLGAPTGLKLLEKLTKNPRTKDSLKDTAFGSFLYAAPMLTRTQGAVILPQVIKPPPPPQPPVSVTGFSHRMPSPYVTEPEFLPFQTDLGY